MLLQTIRHSEEARQGERSHLCQCLWIASPLRSSKGYVILRKPARATEESA
ncbi:MAG: hypothetical protein JW908_05270 [Anaerolineales bacterium]|nr:hypothetical protein [Anaerolineales bacterium]